MLPFHLSCTNTNTYYELLVAIIVLSLDVFVLLLLRLAVAVAIDAQTYTKREVYYPRSIILSCVFVKIKTYARPLNMLLLRLKNVLKDIVSFTRTYKRAWLQRESMCVCMYVCVYVVQCTNAFFFFFNDCVYTTGS